MSARLNICLVPLILFIGGCESMPELSQVLNVPTAEDVVSTETIAAGLREALEIGSRQAVRQLGRPDGFLDSRFHIPLPESLQQARDVAGRFGLAGIFDDRYLRRTTSEELAVQMRPIVDASLAEVGALNTFRSLAEQYNRIPLVTPVEADLTGHVLEYAENALFTLVAREEAAIRSDPAKRTTELLRKVFG